MRTLRKERGLSQREFATISGISFATIGEIELGKRDVRLTTLHSLATALDVSVSKLLEGVYE